MNMNTNPNNEAKAEVECRTPMVGEGVDVDDHSDKKDGNPFYSKKEEHHEQMHTNRHVPVSPRTAVSTASSLTSPSSPIHSIDPMETKRLLHASGRSTSSHSKEHLHRLVKQLADKLRAMEEVVQLELPAIKEQLELKEKEAAIAMEKMAIKQKKEDENQTNELQRQLEEERKKNVMLTQSLIKFELRNKHLTREDEQFINEAKKKDREIKILKESIVDLRRVMTRLPVGDTAGSCPSASSSTSSTGRLLKRKVDNEEAFMKGLSSDESDDRNGANLLHHDISTCDSNNESNESEAALRRLLKKKMIEIAELSASASHVCPKCRGDGKKESAKGNEQETDILIMQKNRQIESYRKKLLQCCHDLEQERDEGRRAIRVSICYGNTLTNALNVLYCIVLFSLRSFSQRN